MGDGFENFETARRQLGLEQLGHASAEQAILMHDDDGLCSLAGGVVELDEVLDGGRRDVAEAGAEAEGVLQPAPDNLVRDADIAEVGTVLTGGSLA